MTETWTLPEADEADPELQARLIASGAKTAPRTAWDIACMIRIAARTIDGFDLLNDDASWLEIRHSRSERAGGLTVQFDRHPDEIDDEFTAKEMLNFRFREGRPKASDDALEAIRRACSRRAMLDRRADALDDGLLTPEGALLCDAVLPAYLRSAGYDPKVLEPSMALSTSVEASGTLVDADGRRIVLDGLDFTFEIRRDTRQITVQYIKLGSDIVYKGVTGRPMIILRRQLWPDTVLASMIGRPVTAFVDHPALRIEGLQIESAKANGDTTTLIVSRIRSTFGEIHEHE